MTALYQRIISGEEGDIVVGKGKADAATRKKYLLTGIFSEYDRRFADGSDEHLGLLDLSCQIAGVLAA